MAYTSCTTSWRKTFRPSEANERTQEGYNLPVMYGVDLLADGVAAFPAAQRLQFPALVQRKP
jgi:hypothetical protein